VWCGTAAVLKGVRGYCIAIVQRVQICVGSGEWWDVLCVGLGSGGMCCVWEWGVVELCGCETAAILKAVRGYCIAIVQRVLICVGSGEWWDMVCVGVGSGGIVWL
jgi:hypothetical protein